MTVFVLCGYTFLIAHPKPLQWVVRNGSFSSVINRYTIIQLVWNRKSTSAHYFVYCLLYIQLNVLFRNDNYYLSLGYLCLWPFIMNLGFRPSETKYIWFCKCSSPWDASAHGHFRTLDIIHGCCFVSDYPCGVWRCWSTTNFLYISSLFGNVILNESWSVTWSFLFVILNFVYMYICIYIFMIFLDI